jgi:hypothetical protein
MFANGIIIHYIKVHLRLQRSRTSRPTEMERPMNILIRAVFAALSLATITPVANAATWGSPHTTYHSGPYDNTGHGGNTGGGGGGG